MLDDRVNNLSDLVSKFQVIDCSRYNNIISMQLLCIHILTIKLNL